MHNPNLSIHHTITIFILKYLILFVPHTFKYAWVNKKILKVNDMPEPQFEIFKDIADKFRFRLRAPNGEIIASSEAYEDKAGCENGIASVKENAPKAVIQDLT